MTKALLHGSRDRRTSTTAAGSVTKQLSSTDPLVVNTSQSAGRGRGARNRPQGKAAAGRPKAAAAAAPAPVPSPIAAVLAAPLPPDADNDNMDLAEGEADQFSDVGGSGGEELDDCYEDMGARCGTFDSLRDTPPAQQRGRGAFPIVHGWILFRFCFCGLLS